jgi:hypothetical protein
MEKLVKGFERFTTLLGMTSLCRISAHQLRKRSQRFTDLSNFFRFFSIPCRFFLSFCACIVVMKKYLITLVVAATAVVHAQAADLASQLLGYWKLDAAQTSKVAEKANREVDQMKLMLMEKRMVYEFQKDQMIIHLGQGFSAPKVPPMTYTVKAVDEKTKSLTLSAGGKEMKIRLDQGKMAQNDPDEGWLVFNPMSKEDFAQFAKAAGAAGGEAKGQPEGGGQAPAAGKLEDVSGKPIPDKPAVGKIKGKEFIMEKATFSDNTLAIWQSGGESNKDDRIFKIMGFQDVVDGKKFSLKPGQDSIGLSAVLRYRKEGEDFAVPENYLNGYSMKLEFGTAKDGKIPGKIHLRLPDKDGSFVEGTFEADIK